VQLERPREQVRALRRRHCAHVERVDHVDVVGVERGPEREREHTQRCGVRRPDTRVGDGFS
jgi:hypothetical protein